MPIQQNTDNYWEPKSNMYAYIKGVLTESSVTKLIIECHGVGYKILIAPHIYTQLPTLGSELCIHVSFVIREFSQQLYGFLSEQEKETFEVLLNISGIGPKLALSMIGHLPLRDLFNAVQRKDLITISKVPGIGKKTAERLVIELQDKLSGILPNFTAEEYSIKPIGDPQSQLISDAMSALINLGYTQSNAQKAVKKTMKEYPDGIDLSTLITKSLANV